MKLCTPSFENHHKIARIPSHGGPSPFTRSTVTLAARNSVYRYQSVIRGTRTVSKPVIGTKKGQIA
jgi:hypothetical protein